MAGVTGTRALKRRLARLRDPAKLVGPTARKALRSTQKRATRRGFGFADRTGKLRRSTRIVQERLGRYRTAWKLVSDADYAINVETAKRTRDGRPGPPFWMGRAWRATARRLPRTIAAGVAKVIARTVGRG